MKKKNKNLAEFLYRSREGFLLCYAFHGIENTINYLEGYFHKNNIRYHRVKNGEFLVEVLILSWWKKILSYVFRGLRKPVVNKIKVLPGFAKDQWRGSRPVDCIFSYAGNGNVHLLGHDNESDVRRRNMGKKFWVIGQHDDLYESDRLTK